MKKGNKMKKIKSIPGFQWAADVLTGQKPFSINPQKSEDKGFGDLLEKEMKKLKGNENSD